VLSAAVFGAVHVEWFVLVMTFLFGIYLALIFRRRGTIVTPIVAHMLFNGLGVVLIRAGVG
jgi:membrane protease YdiL (CAAX protease family)